MVDKEELLNEIKKTKEHLANMEKMLAECEYERWKPKDKQIYYYCGSRCQAYHLKWFNIETDKELYHTFNCFQTKEQAEQEAEKILVRRMLEDIARRLNKGKKIDWSNSAQLKYCLIYSNARQCIDQGFNTNTMQQGSVYCLNINFYNVAIQEIGEERLKKYLKGE